MSFLLSCWEYLFDKFRRNRTIALVVGVLFAVGLLVGMIVAKKNCACWWCQGRYQCIKIVVSKGFFAIFGRFLLNLVVLVALLGVLSVSRATNFAKLGSCLIVGIFVGSYVELLLASYSFWGVLCSVLLYLCLGLICCIAVMVSFCNFRDCCGVYTFVDIVRLNLPSICLLLIGLFVTTLAGFVLARFFVVG